ncbi:MAG TPA: hypothetical protein PLM56_15355 [Cyclobacteriaceae bacterium]|nr:hypothetical protein [Cyclobacteriaceae bacterium]HRE68718.1 hypothetical protein [Cyclobacteriaceae bacterium]HRF34881.1 hypothetical protein [Cyclobacteriaceae bacterium]
MIDIGLYVAYGLFGLSLLAAVVLPAINLTKSPGGLVKSLMGVGALVVLFFVAYLLADTSVSLKAASLGETESSVKMIGAGLILFYIVMVIAVIGIIFSEINKALK